MLDDTNPKKNSFSAEELDDEELCGMEDCKPVFFEKLLFSNRFITVSLLL